MVSYYIYLSQFSSVAQSCPTLCDSMDCSMPGLPVYHQLLEFTQTHVHWVGGPKIYRWQINLWKYIQYHISFSSVQFSSVTQLCPTLCDPMDCSTPGFLVHQQLLEFTQTHVHWAGDAIQPSHPLSSPSPPAFNLSQHQGLLQWVNSLHKVAKVLEFQL